MAAAGINPSFVYMATVGAAAAIPQAATSGYAWGDFTGNNKIISVVNDLFVTEATGATRDGGTFSIEGSTMHPISFSSGGTWSNISLTMPTIQDGTADGVGYTKEMAALISSFYTATNGTNVDLVVLRTNDALVRNRATNKLTLPTFANADLDYVRGTVASEALDLIVTGTSAQNIPQFTIAITPALVIKKIIQA